jgi:[acyl-carrier-protein] S-malonyltransferase
MACGAEEVKRGKDEVERKKRKAEKQRQKALQEAAGAAALEQQAETLAPSEAVPAAMATPVTPVAFLFPGQGSQAVGMLKVTSSPYRITT